MEHDTRQHDQSHDILTVSEAANRLGITPGAVRKRLERKQIDGFKEDGQWKVLVASATRHDTVDVTSVTTADHQTLSLQQLELIRDEWMSPLILQMQGTMEQLADAKGDIARYQERAESLATELDRLRQENEELRTQAAQRSWWRFWKD